MAKQKRFGCLSSILIIGMMVVVLVGLNYLLESEVDRGPSPPSTPAKQAPTLDDATTQMVVDQFVLNDPMVRDVSITQEGFKIKIGVIVGVATDRDYAKQIGDNVVRNVKSLSADESPGKTIGRGIYDYSVVVGTSADDIWWMGVKLAEAASISW